MPRIHHGGRAARQQQLHEREAVALGRREQRARVPRAVKGRVANQRPRHSLLAARNRQLQRPHAPPRALLRRGPHHIERPPVLEEQGHGGQAALREHGEGHQNGSGQRVPEYRVGVSTRAQQQLKHLIRFAAHGARRSARVVARPHRFVDVLLNGGKEDRGSRGAGRVQLSGCGALEKRGDLSGVAKEHSLPQGRKAHLLKNTHTHTPRGARLRKRRYPLRGGRGREGEVVGRRAAIGGAAEGRAARGGRGRLHGGVPAHTHTHRDLLRTSPTAGKITRRLSCRRQEGTASWSVIVTAVGVPS